MNHFRNAVPTVLLLAVAMVGCADPTDIGQGPTLSAAKAATGPSVQAADPAYGYEGQVGKVVAITGSGFDPGSVASWERNGAPDPRIAVVSTEFVSSNLLRATVDISTDAVLTFYDIAVITSKGRKGIGTELFEVTQAVPVPGTSILRGVNENGEFGGSWYGSGNEPAGARFWSQTTGLLTLPPLVPDGGGVWSIDEAGQTMSGYKFQDVGSTPVWTRVSGAWQYAPLPGDPNALHGSGRTIASDPSTGLAIYIAGQEDYKGKGNSTISKPRLWLRGTGGWARVELPSLATNGSGYVEDISPAGVAVGTSNGLAVIWEPNGGGGWSIAYLPGSEFDARGINSTGDLIGGGTNAYWTRTGTGPWILSHLPRACRAVMAVDDLGRIGADNCEESDRVVRPAIFSPPYSAPPVFLGSLGAKGSAANLEKMSLNGSWIAGQINTQGVYWKVF